MADNNIVIKITAESDLTAAQRDLQACVDKAEALDQEYQELSRQMQKTARVMGKESEEYKRLAKLTEQNRKSITGLTKGLKLTDMSMNALRQRASLLRDMLDATSKSADPRGYARLQKQLEETQRVMAKMGEESMATKARNAIHFKALALGATAYWALRNAIRGAFDTIVEFDKASATLASVMGKSQKQVKALTNEAKRLGAATSYTASQMIELETEMAKLGFTETQILQSVEAVQRFATATGSDLASAAGLAGATLRAFGLEATEMERVVSTMAVATTKSALDFGALDTAMSQVAPVAKSLGFSIEDTTALLGQLANSGMDASSAATATRNILLNLSNDSGKLAKALGRPVKSLDDLVPALQNISKKGVDLSEVLELTDKRSVAAFSTFLSGADALKELRDGITGANDEFKKMEETRLKTVSGSIDLMKSAWDGLMLSFSDSSSVMKGVIDWMTSVINKTTEFVQKGGFKDWFAYHFSGDEDLKREIEAKHRAVDAEKRDGEEIAKFRQKSLEEAREYNAQKLKEEEATEQMLIQKAENAYARGNAAEGAYYEEQLGYLENLRTKRKDALDEMEKDEIKAQEKAKKREEEERKRRQKEQEKEAKKNREIAAQELRNKLQRVSSKTNKTEADYAEEIALTKKVAEMEAQVQIDALSKLEMGERAYNAQVAAIRLERDAKIKEIENGEIARSAEVQKRLTDIAVKEAEARKNALTGAEGVDEQKAVLEDYYDTRKKQIEETARLEKEEVHRSTKTQEEKDAAIKAIDTQLNADLVEIKKEGAQAMLDVDSQYLSDLELAADKAAHAYEKAQGGNLLGLLKQQYDAQMELYDAQQKQLKAQYDARLISYQDYKQQEWEITKATTDAEVAYIQEQIQVINDGFQTALGYMQQVSDLAFEALSSSVQAELDELEEMYTTDWEEAQKDANKKYMTEKEYEKKKAELQKKQQRYAKAQAIVNAAIQTAMAIVTTLGQLGATPWGIAASVLAGAMGAAQIGIIASKPLAQYEKGRKGGKGEYALVGEKGPEIMYIPKGASIIPNHKMAKPEDWGEFGVPQMDIPLMPFVNPETSQFITSVSGERFIFDYTKAGEEFAKHLPKQQAVSVHVDRSGVHVNDGYGVHTHLNAKYTGSWN